MAPSPHAFQRIVTPHILKMMAGHLPSEAMMLARGTCGGEYSIPQTIGVFNGGVTLIWENTFS